MENNRNILWVCSLTFVILVMLILNCSCKTKEERKNDEGQQAAQKIAEKVFLEETNGAIKDYSIKPFHADAQHWHFVVEGNGKYDKLGSHWIVRIRKTDGKVDFLPGD